MSRIGKKPVPVPSNVTATLTGQQVKVKGPKGEVGYVLAFQPKSFDWRARHARPHPWGGGHGKVLAAVLKKLDAICGVCEH